MASLDPYQLQLSQIKEEWNKAEHSIKIAEQIGLQVVFPAIKELRYAGRRLIDALTTIESDDDGAEAQARALFDDALFDCYRARHDSIDATISTVSAEMDIAASKLGYRPILDAFPQYPELLKELRNAKEFIANSRLKRNDRDSVYATVENVNMPKITELYRDFKGSEEVMRGLAKADRLWPLIGVAATVLSIIVA